VDERTQEKRKQFPRKIIFTAHAKWKFVTT